MDDGYHFAMSLTPFMISGTDSIPLEQYFEGPIPQVGDAVELYCYATTPTSVSMKWRVRKP